MPWLFLIAVSVLSPIKIFAQEQECSCYFPDKSIFEVQPFHYDWNCYFTLGRKTNFMEARSLCDRTNGELITFHDINEMFTVLPQVRCPSQCPTMCGPVPCSPCNVTLCPYEETISYWINVYNGKYIRQDLNYVDISHDVSRYFPHHPSGQSLMFTHHLYFLAYAPYYVAKPLCKINCLRRSNANFLTSSQIRELRTGLMLFSKDSWQWNLKYFIMTYKFNLKNNKFLYDHNSNVFFHWSRLFLLNFEQLLQRKLNRPIGVPYWDWLTFDLPKLVKPKKFVDLSSKTRRNFFRGIPDDTHKYGSKFVFRNRNLKKTLTKSKCSLWLDLRLALSMNDFCNFLQQYSIVISRILILVGVGKEFSISSPQFAIYDPLLILILANADRHFALWRKMRLKDGRSANLKVCSRPDITNEPLEPFNTQLIWSKLVKENALPKSINTHAHLFYRYDTEDISIYADKLNKECGLERMKNCLWLKIELFDKLSCTTKINIVITIPPKHRKQKHFVVYRDSIYVADHLNMRNNRKFKVCKDVSMLLEKYPHLQDNSYIHVTFKNSKKCFRMLKKPDYAVSFVEGEEKE